METAIYSTLGLLLVSTLSGLAYLAVKHPLVYNPLGKRLLIGLGALGLFGFGFSMGVEVARGVAQSTISPDQMGAFSATMNKIGVASVIAPICLGALIFILWLLAKIGADIYKHEGGEQGEDGKGE